MLTRCPGCATTFRVTAEQLKARQGRVRCGECARVFDALDTLVDEAFVIAAQESLSISVSAAVVAPPVADSLPDFSLPETGVMESAVPSADDPALPGGPTVADSGATDTVPPVTEPPEPVAPTTAPDTTAFEPLPREEQPRHVWPWALGVLVAVALLAAQVLLHFRGEIVIHYPQAKPLFAAACEITGCRLALPRKPELLGIEASDLAPLGDGRLLLTATLRNRAGFAQEYPHLELTLTDTADQPLLRRVLAPAEYLAPSPVILAGLAAGADLAISLNIDTGGTAALGYRLYLFYP